jgi:hypothetical protein
MAEKEGQSANPDPEKQNKECYCWKHINLEITKLIKEKIWDKLVVAE